MKNLKKMKKLMIITVVIFLLILSSCDNSTSRKGGTLYSVGQDGNRIHIDNDSIPNIEVYLYYAADYVPIYVARFKDCPEVVTTNWKRQVGRITKHQTAVTVNEKTIKNEKIKNNREKIILNGNELWLDKSYYPKLWLYSSATDKYGVTVDVLYNGKLISSTDLNDIEKKELLDYLNNSK